VGRGDAIRRAAWSRHGGVPGTECGPAPRGRRAPGLAAGTRITLGISNDRDAIWSGACSSGGNKQKTCTFTLNSNASMSANVQ
jgi:hypothetical protein